MADATEEHTPPRGGARVRGGVVVSAQPLEQRVASVEARQARIESRQREIDAALLRLRGEVQLEVKIEQMIERDLGTVRRDLDEIKRDNKDQLKLLAEAAEERGRRKQREEELALRQRAVSITNEQGMGDADVERVRAETKIRRTRGYAAAIATILAAAGMLAGYVFGSHH